MRRQYAIFGGEDHKTGHREDTEECFRRWSSCARNLPARPVDASLVGQVIETNDGLPYIGETAEKQFAATGYSGQGMTFGTIGGMMARDAVRGRPNPWTELFSPHRTKLKGGAWEYVKENVDYPYFLVKDRLTPAESGSLDSLTPGEGKILRLDGQRVAAYCNEHGETTCVSATCPHMGCVVHWNRSEKTWDCPCHGSRFHPTGELLAGPAESGLKEAGVLRESQS